MIEQWALGTWVWCCYGLVTCRIGASWYQMFQGLHHLHTLSPKLFHSPDCFTVSTLCTQFVRLYYLVPYTDIGSRGYFGVNIALVVFYFHGARYFTQWRRTTHHWRYGHFSCVGLYHTNAIFPSLLGLTSTGLKIQMWSSHMSYNPSSHASLPRLS